MLTYWKLNKEYLLKHSFINKKKLLKNNKAKKQINLTIKTMPIWTNKEKFQHSQRMPNNSTVILKNIKYCYEQINTIFVRNGLMLIKILFIWIDNKWYF
jgi:hypothetical protein